MVEQVLGHYLIEKAK